MIDNLIENLSYSDGRLYWAKPRPKVVVGSRAGYAKKNGYREIKFNGKSYKEHRVIWAIINGAWPSDELDHVNKDKSDNRIENLREATRSQNMANSLKKRGSSSFNGVCWKKRFGKWHSQIMSDGKKRHLGWFDLEYKAALAYDAAAIDCFGEFATLNFKEAC